MSEIRVAVVSDTHGSLSRSVVRELADCSCILHAGDIVRENILDELALYGHLYAVQGNCDRWMPGLENLAGTLRFEIGGVSFFMVHDPEDVPRNLEGVDVVVHGHTHVYREERIGKQLWLNPGSCGRPRLGSTATMAKLTIRDGRVAGVRKIELE